MTTEPKFSPAKEPRFALPSRLIFFVTPPVAGLLAVLWLNLAQRIGFTPSETQSGAWGIAMVMVVYLGGWAVISPWKSRLAGDWIGWWIGSQACRLLLTPVAAYLLYCRAPADPRGLVVAVSATYCALLCVETALVARSLSRELDRFERHGNPSSGHGRDTSVRSSNHDQSAS